MRFTTLGYVDEQPSFVPCTVGIHATDGVQEVERKEKA